MIKLFIIISVWERITLWGSVSFVFVLLVNRAANAKTYFLHYDIYIKVLSTKLNLSLH